MKRLVVLFWLCLPGISWGAITFDAQSESTMFDAISFSWTHAVGAGCTNNIVIVSISHYNANFTTLTDVTIGGVSAGVSVATLGGAETLTMFRRVGAGTGNKTIQVNFSGANAIAIGTARSYCGGQALALGTPVTNSSDNAFTVTVDVPSAPGELVIDSALILMEVADTATEGAGQTLRSSLMDLTQSNFRLVESDEAGAAPNVTMSWSLSINRSYYTIGAPLRETGTTSRRRIIVIQ